MGRVQGGVAVDHCYAALTPNSLTGRPLPSLGRCGLLSVLASSAWARVPESWVKAAVGTGVKQSSGYTSPFHQRGLFFLSPPRGYLGIYPQD